MNKLLGILFIAVSLAACSSMSTSTMGNTSNPKETKNSTDTNKAGNPAAVSPGGGGGGSSGTGR